MRLHRLEMSAFGPFADTQVVDFDALCAPGLFLVVGPTGAGKSTVLDAVTFALFGEAAGGRGRRGLRSDHAPAGAEPRVVLEVSVRGRRLRITRCPEWSRPRRRGEGTVVANPRVLVEELDGDQPVPRATRVDEAAHLLRGLVGMSREQFCQVALLPQGQFARFLRADSEERRGVLERLFSVEVLTAAETWLAEHRTALGRRRDEAHRAVLAVADRLAEAAAVDRPEAAEQVADLAAWARQVHGRADERLSATRAALADATAHRADAAAALERATGLVDRQRRHAQYVARAAALAEQTEAVAAAAAELDAAGRAERVQPLVRALRACTAARRDREREVARAAAAAHDAGLVTDPAAVPPAAALAALRDEHRARAAILDALREDAERLTDLRAGITQALTEVDKLRTEQAGIAADLAAFPQQDRRMETDVARAQQRAAGQAEARAAVTAAEDALAAVRHRDALADRLDAATADLATLVEDARQRHERARAVTAARLAAMAAELAADLRPDRPCPVCGATEHPAPAAADEHAPGQDDEDAAQHAYEQARAAAEQARSTVDSLRGRLAELADRAGGLTAEQAAADLRERQAALDDALAAAARAADLTAGRAELRRRWDRERERAVTVEVDLAAAEERLVDRSAEAERLAERLDRARGEDATVHARAERLARQAELLADLAAAVESADVAAAGERQARDAARAAATAAGFTDPEQAAEAERDGRTAAALRARLRDHDDALAAVREGLSDPDLQTAAAQAGPDLPGLRDDLDRAETDHRRALAAESLAARAAGRIGQLCGELDEALAGFDPAEQRYQVAHRIAQLVAGTSQDNRWRMRLSAYVLAARLAQVVTEANHRLDDMSAGRFQLTHSAERRTGERRGGLGLRVVDNWTGAERDTATLSGGEQFYVSLALALGLMAVVTAEAGGAELGTLFIDEGFGSLDEDTLDDVMDVLDGLRDRGRAVGIVSHVADLRGRVPTQLRVRRTATGSAVEHAVAPRRPVA